MSGDPTGPTPPGNETPEAVLARYAEVLCAAAEAAVAGWVVRCVERRWREWSGSAPGEDLRAAAAEAGEAARAQAVGALRALLALDPDDQRTGPLAVLRRAVAHPTAVLRVAGVPPVVRDDFAVRTFPDDDYDLSPAAFADIDPSLHEPGLVWGAAKAHVVLTRRRGRS
jgi:hypothetical protein